VYLTDESDLFLLNRESDKPKKSDGKKKRTKTVMKLKKSRAFGLRRLGAILQLRKEHPRGLWTRGEKKPRAVARSRRP